MKNLTHHYLELNKLELNPKLARKFPPDLARRYHVLPVSMDGERITVAMADPNNVQARNAVFTTLGESTCIVQANLKAIDGLMEELWPEVSNHVLNFLTWLPTDSLGVVVKTYAQAMSDLLGARLFNFDSSMTGKDTVKALIEKVDHTKANLVIYRAPCQSLLKKLVNGSFESKLTDLIPISSLLVHGFRWPIKKILLVIRFEDSDEASLDWAVYLAKMSDAFVTILPITIPVPPYAAQRQTDIYTWRNTNNPIGERMRRVACRLAEWEIEGNVHLRNNQPPDQIRYEVMEENHDLIVIAADPENWFRRRLFGNLISSILEWADRPLLIAKQRIESRKNNESN